MQKIVKFVKDTIYRSIFTLDLLASKYIYQDSTGFQLNYTGMKRWKKNKKLSRFKHSSAGHKINEGYCFFTHENKELISKIREKYLSMLDDQNHTYFFDKDAKVVENPSLAACKLIRNPVASMPEILELIDEKVVNLLYEYYGCYFKIDVIDFYRTMNLSSEKSTEVFAHRLHYDRHPIDNVKLFINLSDVGPDSGAFNFFSKEYSRKILKNGYKDRDNYGKAENLINSSLNLRKLEGPVGSSAICNTMKCLHRAGIPQKGKTRDLLIFLFESSSIPFDSKSPEVQKEIIVSNDNHNSKYILPKIIQKTI